MSDARVKQAFIEVRQGRCPEYVICDSDLNEQFLSVARRLGITGSDAEINSALMNLRKQNRLKDCPTTQRKRPDPERDKYINAVANVVRLVERQFQKSVDDVICDPILRAQFTALITFVKPDVPAFEAEYAALSLRKANKLKPEPVGQVIRAVGSRLIALVDLEAQLSKLPTKPGVYIFFDEEITLYAGKADSLRARISDHVSTWAFRDLVKQIKDKRRPPAFAVYHELPVAITAKELAAYELELIRSRSPLHNRAGKTA